MRSLVRSAFGPAHSFDRDDEGLLMSMHITNIYATPHRSPQPVPLGLLLKGGGVIQ